MWDIELEESQENLPWIGDQSHQLRVFIVDLFEDPMLNGLADSIRRGKDWALFHTANTAQWASHPHELGSLALLQEWDDKVSHKTTKAHVANETTA